MPNDNSDQNDKILLKLIELGRIKITNRLNNTRKLNIRFNQTGWESS